jgi:hypothetical protein
MDKNKWIYVMKKSRKELHDIDELSQHVELEEKSGEKGLTQRQKEILGETKQRHDKALRRLAQM